MKSPTCFSSWTSGENNTVSHSKSFFHLPNFFLASSKACSKLERASGVANSKMKLVSAEAVVNSSFVGRKVILKANDCLSESSLCTEAIRSFITSSRGWKKKEKRVELSFRVPRTLSCKHNANAQKRTKERKDETLNKVFSLYLCNNLYIIEYFKEETRKIKNKQVSMCPRKVDVQRERMMEFFCHCIFHSTWCGRLRVSASLLIWPSVLRSSSNRPIIFWILSLFVACVEPGKGWKINSKKQIPHYFSGWFYITKYQTTKSFWFFVCFGGRYDLKIHVLDKLQHKSLTFHHLHILQGKFPQKLVFTWSINHAGSRVSKEGWRKKQERCNREKKVNIWCTYCLTPGGSMV